MQAADVLEKTYPNVEPNKELLIETADQIMEFKISAIEKASEKSKNE